VSGEPAEEPGELRATSAVRRALSKSPPEAVAAAACEFITGPLPLDSHQIGKRLLPRWTTGLVRVVALTGSSTESTTRLAR